MMQNWVLVSSLSVALVVGAINAPTDANWYHQGYSDSYIVYDRVQDVTKLEYQGNKFAFKSPRFFSVERTEDGYQIEDNELEVHLFADTLQELQDDLNFILEDNFINYASKSDDALASDAQKLKQSMLKLIEVA